MGDEILVYISDEVLESCFKLDIFFEDANILIINKPVNIEVTGENSLTTEVHKHFSSASFKPMPCHRLDRNTTGLVLFAKNDDALNVLLSKFKNHEIEKHYKALVYGVPKIKKARLEAYLFKDTKKSLVYISDNFKNGYQKIITSYMVLKENNEVNKKFKLKYQVLCSYKLKFNFVSSSGVLEYLNGEEFILNNI